MYIFRILDIHEKLQPPPPARKACGVAFRGMEIFVEFSARKCLQVEVFTCCMYRKNQIKPVYSIHRLSRVRKWWIRARFWLFRISLNVMKILRKAQSRTLWAFVFIFSQQGEFVHLPLVVSACEWKQKPSSLKDHDDSFLVCLYLLISLYIILSATYLLNKLTRTTSAGRAKRCPILALHVYFPFWGK